MPHAHCYLWDKRVIGKTSCQAALEAALTQPPDIILTDLMMPGMSGEEFNTWAAGAVESGLDKGSCFWIELPLNRESVPPPCPN